MAKSGQKQPKNGQKPCNYGFRAVNTGLGVVRKLF